jgi:hypothetical protein
LSSPATYPKFHAFDPSTGLPLVGGKLTTFAAGTSTPLATYADAALTVANANPVILDANGEAVIYVGPLAYKFVLTKADLTAVWTFDNYAPNLAFPSPSPSGWVQFTTTPITFINTTSFSTTGDATATFPVGRRLRTSNTAGTIYSTITVSNFAAGVTTVTVVSDATGVLDSGLSAVYYGLETFANPSYLDPRSAVSSHLTADITGYAAKTAVTTYTEDLDTLNEYAAGIFVAKYPGKYLVAITAECSDTAAAVTGILTLRQTAADIAEARFTTSAVNQFYNLAITRVVSMNAAETLSVFFQGAATTTLRTGVANGTLVAITRLP